jgi:hypothetical protein
MVSPACCAMRFLGDANAPKINTSENKVLCLNEMDFFMP